MANDTVDRNAFATLASFLDSIGLGSLFSYSNGEPSGWLWEQVKSGIVSRESLEMALEQTPEFRQRFGVIFDMRNQAAQSGGGYVPTVADVIGYEREFFRVMASSGLPQWFYDDMQDAHNALRSNLSVTQIADRIEAGYQRVQAMPTEVRNVFDEYYGANGDQALLAAVLDPQKTLDEIDRAVRTAQVGAALRGQGFDLERSRVEYFSGQQLTESQIRAGAAEAGRLRPLTEETFGERATNLTEEVAVNAALGGNAEDQAALEQRLLGRQVRQRTVGGGAVAGQSGITGAGIV